MNKRGGVDAGDRQVLPGTKWLVDGGLVTIARIAASNRVVVTDEEGTQRTVRPGELRGIDSNDAIPLSLQTAANITDEDWEHARSLQTDIEATTGNGETTRAVVDSLAKKWMVSRATVWRRIRRYQREHSLLALIDRAPGPLPGSAQISSEIESLIVEIARRWWRQTENATITEIGPDIQSECNARKIKSPSRATIARRLRALRADPDNFSGEARAALKERTRLMRDSYKAADPLGVVQIDHTVADVFVIDSTSRQPIGRPTLTVAIDVATRCVLGICLSLEAPSSLLVALCLEHAVFPKDDWVRAMGSSVEWPMYGRMSALHSDNGREFHSSAFRRGCDLNRISVIYRPPATPRFGGHVERLIGTLMRRIRLLPGSSYSDFLRRRPKNAETRAAMTMEDLRLFLAEEIAHYHHRRHRGIGMPPRTVWERGWTRKQGIELPPLPRDRMRFLLDFLPALRRVVGREGIDLFGLKYSHSSLAPEVSPGRDRIVRFDPRDLSRIHLEQPEGRYLTVPLRDRSFPSISLWEWRAIRKHQRAVATHCDAAHVRGALMSLERRETKAVTPLVRRRRSARHADWQTIQTLQALPVPSVCLSATLTSEANLDDFSWEILE
jgi:putative transposase